ncbi:MAG: sulfotransferase [Deltaproteobacteria bacterium]|nr:sulfotransferase [Deltaproteobacteria bacterium]
MLKRVVPTVKKIKQALFFPVGGMNKIVLNKRVLVATHHKTGTKWLATIFKKISIKLRLKYFYGRQENLPKDFDIFFQDHSTFDFDRFQNQYKGLHMIRDPRDTIVSGCFYHRKSREHWLHIKRKRFGGLSYQEKINSYESFDDQLLFEMEHSGRGGIQAMLAWDYDNSAFLEVKYEDLIKDTNLFLFHKIFAFLGFPGRYLPEILKISYENSLFSGKLRRSDHLRSGKTGQWEKYFKPTHKKKFLALFDNSLIKLGYETDNKWADI